MGMLVRGFEDILWALESVPPEGRLFCFFAFDDRPSHRVVLDFLEDSITWIDSLSAAAGIFSLVFTARWEEIAGPLPEWYTAEAALTWEQGQELDRLPKEIVYVNPSLELAKRFGVRPRDLPGLIVFDSLSTGAPVHSAYVPLELPLFTGQPEALERILAEIFSRVQEARERNAGKSSDQLFGDILTSLSSIRQSIQPLPAFHDDLLQVVREVVETTAAKPYHVQTIKILFLAANPKDTDPLRLGEEMRAIDQALLQAEYRDWFEIKQQWAVRVADIQGHLLRHQPDIVHFSGHGSATSEILLEDDTGTSQPVSVRALSQLFLALKDNIKCVVLNACYSEPQAKAIAEHIDCVIGMSRAIGDEAAVNFAKAFYQALGYGKDIQAAFDLGRNQIDLDGLDEQDTPKLLALRRNPKDIVLVNGG